MTSCGNPTSNKNGSSKTGVIQEKHLIPKRTYEIIQGMKKSCFTVWKKPMVCELDSETDLVEPFFKESSFQFQLWNLFFESKACVKLKFQLWNKLFKLKALG